MATKLRESGNASHSSNDTSGHLGQANHGPSARYNHVAIEDRLGSAPHADTIDSGNDRFGASSRAHTSEAAALESLDRLVDFGVRLHGLARSMPHRLGRLVLAEPVFEILSSAEGSALACKDDDPQGRLRLEPFKYAADILLHGVCHRIELLGSVERHLQHVSYRGRENQVRADFGHQKLRRGHDGR